MSNSLSRFRVLAVPLFCALLACDPAGGEDGDDDGRGEAGEGGDNGQAGGLTQMDEDCGSGLRWAAGDLESPLMHPGVDCIDCHRRRGEAEEINVAGTVYDALNEADDCYGADGVQVILTGSDGQSVTLTSNASGNFYGEHVSIATPYTAKLVYDGRERIMATPQTDLSCNSCHGQTGTNAAPGRIQAP